MKIDLEEGTVEVSVGEITYSYDIGSKEAFALISKAWIRSGWDAKYVYSFSWMGRPIIQLPEDMMRIQELIYATKPDVIVETGVAHGGSLIFYASLARAMGKGRVVGIDIDIREHNRNAIEEHELFDLITLIEGSSIDNQVLDATRHLIDPHDSVLVLLDSNHAKAHVLEELRLYADLVTKGSFIVACDGIMQDLNGAPRTQSDWTWNNPQEAVREFLMENGEFELVEPKFPFNESLITQRVTYWPNAFLRRKMQVL
jgi:cephalosporin hydroxylase